MRIPTSFHFKGRRWTVEVKPRLDDFVMGQVFHKRRYIEIGRRSTCGNWRYTYAQQYETFIHEILHAALKEVSPKHNKHALIDPLAKALAQILRTSRFD